jgi:hypothetical protein
MALRLGGVGQPRTEKLLDVSILHHVIFDVEGIEYPVRWLTGRGADSGGIC